MSVLLCSVSESCPGGLGNSSSLLGRYATDHVFGTMVMTTVPGISERMYLGRKANGFIIPRFVNVEGDETDFHRGYSFQALGVRAAWTRGEAVAGLGRGLKEKLRRPGAWIVAAVPSVECLPREEDQVAVNFKATDRYGLPLTRIDVRWSDNERRASDHTHRELVAMLELLNGKITDAQVELAPPGMAIHEMGGACMGADPRASVTNAFNQLHDAPNVFVTDGAFMNSPGDRNPSLIYIAFTARAAACAVAD